MSGLVSPLTCSRPCGLSLGGSEGRTPIALGVALGTSGLGAFFCVRIRLSCVSLCVQGCSSFGWPLVVFSVCRSSCFRCRPLCFWLAAPGAFGAFSFVVYLGLLRFCPACEVVVMDGFCCVCFIILELASLRYRRAQVLDVLMFWNVRHFRIAGLVSPTYASPRKYSKLNRIRLCVLCALLGFLYLFQACWKRENARA